MDDFEKELKVGFLDEAAQLLSDAEQCFLNLENAAGDPSIIEKIFRLAHNLKGSARAVGFSDIAEFTHQLESMLLKIKNREMQIQEATVNLLLQCNDHLNRMVNILKTDMDARVDSSELLHEIGRHLRGEVPASVSAEAVSSAGSEVPSASEVLAVVEAESKAEDGSEAVPEEVESLAEPDQQLVDDLTEELVPTATPEAQEIFSEIPTEETQKSEFPKTEPNAEMAPVVSLEAVREQRETVTNAASTTPAVPVPSPAAAAPSQPQSQQQQDESIRVSLKRLELLMNNVGELVILQAVLIQHKASIESMLVQKTIDQFSKIIKDVQDISMSLRMVPLKQTFQKMQRIVRDVSKSLNKEVRLEISGEETEMDKIVLEQVGDPLVHLIRNAVDHGLESNEERVKQGKPSQGVVKLQAYHKGNHIAIEVVDDGYGLDPQRLIKKAVEKGIIKSGANLSDEQAYQLIFSSGFSTKSQVTDISGRGVGMDVVKSNITALQGEIQIETVLGKGSCFRILLPLTLSIIDGMLVQAGGERFVVPISQVYESVQPVREDVHYVTNIGEVLSLRGENLPLFRLGSVLGRKLDQRDPWDGIAVVIRSGKYPFAVLVDDIIGHQQVVIKRLGKEIQHIKGLSGGAILGDGKAALILDFAELVSKVSGRAPTAGTSGTSTGSGTQKNLSSVQETKKTETKKTETPSPGATKGAA